MFHPLDELVDNVMGRNYTMPINRKLILLDLYNPLAVYKCCNCEPPCSLIAVLADTTAHI
jgi:hypothetical protein